MRIGIVGPGALGCLFSGLLAKSGADVILFDKRPDRARRINREGVTVHSEQAWKIRVPVTSNAKDLKDCRLILITVKSYDTELASQMISEGIDSEANVLTVQNGLGNYETLSRILGKRRVLVGVTRQASTLLREGCVKHTFSGETVMGAWKPVDSGNSEAIANYFSGKGIATSVALNIRREAHRKLIINAAINPLTSLVGVRNGELAEHTGLRSLVRLIVYEACSILAAVGFNFDPHQVEVDVMRTVSDTAENKSSMLQDLERGKRTEIDSINGALVRMAERVGIPCPVNSALAELVRAISNSRERFLPERLATLVDKSLIRH